MERGKPAKLDPQKPESLGRVALLRTIERSSNERGSLGLHRSPFRLPDLDVAQTVIDREGNAVGSGLGSSNPKRKRKDDGD